MLPEVGGTRYDQALPVRPRRFVNPDRPRRYIEIAAILAAEDGDIGMDFACPHHARLSEEEGGAMPGAMSRRSRG